jgi:hypothetical protein
MRYYFSLQAKIIHRLIAESGIPIAICYLAIPTGFVGLSMLLFHKTEFAPYILFILPTLTLNLLSNKNRNDFLKITFGPTKQRTIRIIENLLVTLPFALLLIFKGYWHLAMITFPTSAFIALLDFQSSNFRTLPSPFAKHNFEFNTLFRKSLIPLLGIYILALFAIKINNVNLGIASIVFLSVLILSHFSKPENEFFVWNYSLTANQFLIKKIKSAFVNTLVLLGPIGLVLAYYFQDNVYSILFFTTICLSMVVATILSKYSSFPHEISISQGIILAFAISIPPALILFIPLTYKSAKSNIKFYLK